MDHRLTAHVARRHHVYMFPNPFRTRLYGTPGRPPEATRLEVADRVEYVILRTALPSRDVVVWAEVGDEFELVAGNEYWRLYRRAGAG